MKPGMPQLEICDKAVMNWAPAGCEVKNQKLSSKFLLMDQFCIGTWPVSAQARFSAVQVLLASLSLAAAVLRSVYHKLFRLQHSCTIISFLLFCTLMLWDSSY